ncbi:MAG: NupC/NupG family nucleoside CNT transporter [Chitinophagales bacterium]|nr:NupC/NupG family nucleoside CNT transporter [Chitinophagales bacterium]
MDILRGLLGITALIFITYLLSNNKKNIDWKLVGSGLLLQIVFAVLVLKVPFVYGIFNGLAKFFVDLLDFSKAGSVFLFGGLVENTQSYGFIFAFQVLPTIVFFAALTSLLYYLGILQKIVFGFAWIMSKTMRLSGAESLAAASNIFIGQTEAPLVVKPYLEKMTKSEIMCLMTGGMATIAGGVFFAFIEFLGGEDPEMRRVFASHLLTASIMSAPAAIVAAKILFPESDPDQIDRTIEVPQERAGANSLDAIANGTKDGVLLAVNVAAMLLVFIAFIAMVNYGLKNLIGDWTGLNEKVVELTSGKFDGFTLEFLFGMLFAPFAWLLGVPSTDILLVGQLLGEKTIINEFVAYASLQELKELGALKEFKSVLIATYALCGFSNFSSIGIQIGGIGSLAPGQRATLAQLGIKALIGGTVACFLTATIAGVLL